MSPSDVATTGGADRRLGLVRGDWLDAMPAALVATGAVVGLVSAQGGYFATSWGWTSTALLWVVGLWAVANGRTDAGRLDVAFVGLLTLLLGWVALSIAWSVAPALTVLEVQRVLVLVAGVGAVLVLAQRRHVSWLIGSALLAIVSVSTYALATRLFPEHLGSYDPIAGYRLSEPLGYWNGLGILSAMGLLVATGVVADAPGVRVRVLAGSSTVALATTLYFTYSRGAWLALAIGAAIVLVASPHRLRAIGATIAVGLPAAAGVLVASRFQALTTKASDLSSAADDGRRLALLLVALSLVGALTGLLVHVVDTRVAFPRAARLAATGVLVAGTLAVAALVVARFGSPVTMAERAWDSFAAPPPVETTDLNSRLFSFSSNGRVELWSAAWDVSRDHPALGSGAGSFERLWQARGDSTQRVRDAHGLYIETLGELGPLGLALLVAALATPLAGALVSRRTAMVPAVTGAYGAFLVHAGVDWDWELAGLTLAGLLLGCILVVSARGGPTGLLPSSWRAALGAAAAVASLAAIVGGLGSSALAHSKSSTDRGDVADAVQEANRARQLMPWSGKPWLYHGEALLATGDRQGAVASFRRSLEIDDRDWVTWLDLAIATDGADRRAALARARSLYPRSTEIAGVARELAEASAAQG